MDVITAFILGAIQGITEFIPVSSSGHLSLAELLLHVRLDEDTMLTFDILIHLATAFGIIIYYMTDIYDMLVRERRQLVYLLIASVPVFVMGALFAKNIEYAKTQVLVIGIGFVGTAIFLTGGEVFAVKKSDRKEPVKFVDAILIGLAQAVALLPGVSRSGSTIGSALICGVNRRRAVDFSFMLGIPAILGAAAWKMMHFNPGGANLGLTPILVGTFTAFGLTFVAIPLTIRIVRSGKLYWFAAYCFLVGLGAIFYEIFKISRITG